MRVGAGGQQVRGEASDVEQRHTLAGIGVSLASAARREQQYVRGSGLSAACNSHHSLSHPISLRREAEMTMPSHRGWGILPSPDEQDILHSIIDRVPGELLKKHYISTQSCVPSFCPAPAELTSLLVRCCAEEPSSLKRRHPQPQQGEAGRKLAKFDLQLAATSSRGLSAGECRFAGGSGLLGKWALCTRLEPL
jgi:hypothetical protein